MSPPQSPSTTSKSDALTERKGEVLRRVAAGKEQVPAGLRLVTTEAEATLRLYVTGREEYDTGSAVSTGSGNVSQQGSYTGSGVTKGISGARVHSVLRVGQCERVIKGESGSYNGAAMEVLESVMIWVVANRSRLSDQAAAPPQQPPQQP